MPREVICWVITLNRLYLTHWNIGSVGLDRDLQKAFRYQSERDAEFVARKVSGEVHRCRIGRNGLEVMRDELH